MVWCYFFFFVPSEINSIMESPVAFVRNETTKVFYINYIRNVHILKGLPLWVWFVF